jgi:hypothetical protein
VLPPGATSDSDSKDFVIETDDTETSILFTDVDDATLVYIFKVTQTGRFSPLFVSALSWLLASSLAGPIMKGKTGIQLRDDAYDKYLKVLGVAAAASLNQMQDSAGYAEHVPEWMSDR